MHKSPKKLSSKHVDLKRIERALKESEKRFHRLVDQLPDTVLVHDLEGKILLVNSNRVELLGAKTAEGVLGRNAMEFVCPDDREKIKNIIMSALENYKKGDDSKRTIEHKFLRLDGTEFYGEATGVFFDYNGQIAIQVIIRDITQRKQAEEALKRINDNLESMIEERTTKLSTANELLKREVEERKLIEEQKEKVQTQLLQAQKMEIVGRFASGIAHDFNNITTIIRTLSGLALTEVSKGLLSCKLTECLEIINATTERTANLTRQLLISARNQPTNFKQLSLNSSIENMSKILNHILNKNIVIRTVLAPGLWDIIADKGNIDQILMNLVLNARDSIAPGGGMIYIKTENVIIDEERDDIPGAKPGRFICLMVEDSGAGMDSEVVKSLFEPFFSTKEPGKGMGLGLSVVSTIIKEHDGVITVSSEPDRGSIFKIYLPAITDSALSEVNDNTLMEPMGHEERILLVEDENFLRQSVMLMLSDNNYAVFQAETAEEAIDIFKKENGKFDMVFTDVVLPDLSGVLLIKELLAIKPDLKVLFTSGYMNIESQWPFMLERGYNFLQKPYDQTDLLAAFKETLKT